MLMKVLADVNSGSDTKVTVFHESPVFCMQSANKSGGRKNA